MDWKTKENPEKILNELVHRLESHRSLLDSKKIILGSSSPRRKELLEKLFDFSIEVSLFSEDLNKELFQNDLRNYPVETSRIKCEEIFERKFKSLPIENQPDLIITSDSVVLLGNRIIEKPSSQQEAINIISDLSGKEHTVVTAVTLFGPKTGFQSSFFEETIVKFESLSPSFIEEYAKSGIGMGKAGAYGIQDFKIPLSFKGCFFNCMGFPIVNFTDKLIELLNISKF